MKAQKLPFFFLLFFAFLKENTDFLCKDESTFSFSLCVSDGKHRSATVKMDAQNLDFWPKTAFLKRKVQNMQLNVVTPERGFSTFTGVTTKTLIF